MLWESTHASVTLSGNVATMASDSLPGNCVSIPLTADRTFCQVSVVDAAGNYGGSMLMGFCEGDFDPLGDTHPIDTGKAYALGNYDQTDLANEELKAGNGERIGLIIDKALNKGYYIDADGVQVEAFTFPSGADMRFLVSGYAFSGTPPGNATATIYGHGEIVGDIPEGCTVLGAPESEAVATIVLQSGYSATVDGNVVSIVKD